MLKVLFNWLDHHPDSYWLAAIASLLLLAAWIVSALRADASPAPRKPESRFWAALVLLIPVLAWRWPFLLSATEYNPDESQIIAGVITLTKDPVFWRSVDGTSSGPLNFYALLPIHWIGAPLDYFTVRLAGLLMVWAAIWACYEALKTRYGLAAARLGVLPTIIFFSLVHEWDFIHFSSEHLSLALTAIAVYQFVRMLPPGENGRRYRLAGGFIAGLLPWAKLQAAPVGLALVFWGCWICWRSATSAPAKKRRHMVELLTAAVAPSILAFIAIALTGQTETFVRNYLLQNLEYATSHRAFGAALRGLWVASSETHLFSLLLLANAMVIGTALVVILRQRKRPDPLFWGGTLLTIVAAVCVILPQRGYLHYVLLMIVPLGLWGGAAFGDLWSRLPVFLTRCWLSAVFVFFVAALPVGLRFTQPEPEMYGRFAQHWRRPNSPAGEVLRILSHSGDRLAIWGWLPRLYVESRLPQATRQGYTYWAIMPSSQRTYHRRSFLEELQHSQPAFFVDGVGADSYYFQNRREQAHESFPELANYVAQNYALLADLGYARIYVHPDRLPQDRLTIMRLLQLIDDQPAIDDIEHIPEQDLALTQLPERNIDGRQVRMMLPPAEAVWPLDGTEREFIFEYGYDPVAWQKGEGGEGTEYRVELVTSGRAPSQLFRRVLDPAHIPTDRGPQTTRIVLSPFPPGTRLRVQTMPARFNDNSWAWTYITRIRFRRDPGYTHQQFPRFNRLPATAEAEYSSLLQKDGEPLRLLHAPAALTYVMGGSERRLRFDYGFLPGAYSNGGQTDGAVFRVALHCPDQPDRIVFERFLQPCENTGDRGDQSADLPLPALRRDDQLQVTIGAGPANNNAWDWTYITHFFLE
jgi:hypothetical protein